MEFCKVREVQEVLKDDKFIPVEMDVILNIDEISLIRESSEGILVFMTGRDKALKIVNKDDINTIMKSCGLKKINEGKK